MAQVKSDRSALGRRRPGPTKVRPTQRSGKTLPALALIRNTLLDSDGPAEDLTDRLNQNLLGDASPLFIADPGGALLYANRAYRRIEETLVASGECPPAEQVAATLGSMEAPLKRELTVEINGRTRSYALEQHLLNDHAGEPLAVVGRLDSIDEPKRLRASLALSEERFNDIARLVSDWVWETDQNLKLTYVSPRVINALGYHPRELLGRHLAELTSEPPLVLSD